MEQFKYVSKNITEIGKSIMYNNMIIILGGLLDYGK